MGFEIAEVQEADLPELGTLHNKVWDACPWSFRGHAFPLDEPAKMYRYTMKRLTQAFNEKSIKQFKVVDTSKQLIVSYAAWEIPTAPNVEEGSRDDISDLHVPDTFFPEGSNLQLLKAFYAERERIKAKLSDPTQDYYLRSMMTLPEYQGQGLASMLLRQGLKEIDAQGRRCYLEATPVGLPIYIHLGWKVVDEIKIDLGAYGIPNPYVEVTACLIREPAATKG